MNKSKKVFLHILLILCSFSFGFAQFGGPGNNYTISGLSVVDDGSTQNYTLNNGSSISNTVWGIPNTYGYVESSTYNTARIVFTAHGTTSISAFVTDTNGTTNFVSKSVTILPGLSAGTISGEQTICYQGDPATITNTSAASGGSGGYSYQWQDSPGGGTLWYNINGATSLSYNPPGGLTASRWYRRRVTSGTRTKYTDPIRVLVNQPLNAGSINGVQTVCYGGDPSILGNSASPSNGLGGYTYQWQLSSNNSSWSNISGATASTYNPPGNQTATRWYRRRVISCGQTKYTGSVKVTVRPNLSAGAISGTQTVCYSGDPSTLGNGVSPSGGNGSYAYQWQISSNNSSWNNISGATASTYNPPGNQTATRWYRRRVISCGQTRYTGSVKVTIRPNLSAGAISGTQTICHSGDPGTLGNSTSPSGGNGSYAYQWQISSNNSSWSTISGATASTYNPPSGQTATRWYRRRVISCGQTGYTGSVKVTVISAVSTPTLASTVNNCGETVLTMGTVPSGETWYWQGSPGGTSTSNSTSSVTRTSGTLYYLRAKSNSGSCWGTALTINYTINTGAVWYADTDGDGFGDPTSSTRACSRPTGYAENGDDRNVSVAGGHFGTTDPSPGSGGYAQVTKSNENYIHTLTYQNPLKGNDPISLNGDVIEQVTYFDGLGRGKQQVAIKASGREPQNFDYTSNVPEWSLDWTPGSGGTPFFNQNGSTVENQRINGSDPHGAISLLWECGNEADNHADGGWNTDYFAVDKNAAYRYTVWVKRTHSQNGTTYHGTQNVNNLNGSANGNPYFWAGDLPQLNTWYLLVGIVHPVGHSGGDSGVSGVYDLQGNKVIDGTEYAWSSTTTTTRFRSYLYYATDVGVRQYFHQPVLQKLDGTEDILGDIIAGTAYSGELKDLVTHMGYDDYGRRAKEWLPYRAVSGNLGSFRSTAETDTDSYYVANYSDDIVSATPNPFSERAFEASPMSRVLKQAAPGYDWRMGGGHEVGFVHSANLANEVRRYKVTTTIANNTFTPTLVANGHYAVGQLHKTVTKDENWSSGTDHTTEEFIDKQGRVVLKRTYNNGAHDTYYVYDDYGNLTYVIPPKVDTSNGVSTTELNELCYQYKYDYRNRLVEKKLPGKGTASTWEEIVYNKLDQPIMTRDPNLRVQGKWLFTKYDAIGRIVYTGKMSSNSNRVAFQNAVNAETTLYETKTSSPTTVDGTSVYYNNAAYPRVNITEILTINYYDNYTFDGFTAMPSTVEGATVINHDNSASTQKLTKGLATGTKVKVLGSSPAKWTTTVTGYDEKGRSIYVKIVNGYLGTTDIVTSKLDFTGKVVRTKASHTKGTNAALVTTDNFSYDHRGRLVKQEQTIGSHTETIVQNSYDNLGQLVQKEVGGGLQTVKYAYNVRGWLKRINNPTSLGGDLFGFGINYNTVSHSGTPLYNGNIAETEWRTANTDNGLKWYRYAYDPLNRITSATANSSNYSLSGITYDKNGNLQSLTRRGHTNAGATSFGNMDVLVYTYDSGNKLTKVLDNGNDTYGFKDSSANNQDYWYDANGNMVRDLNKGIGTASLDGITYNHLNLPEEIKFDNNTNKKITYIYDALGAKIQKVANDNGSLTTTDYAGNFVYENGTLQFFSHPEGYVNANGGGYDYVYQYKDHLGNIRLSYADDPSNPGTPTIIEENNYYPFGLKHRGYNIGGDTALGNDVAQRWKYSGKEYDESLDLNTYDFGARNYDPTLGRWMNIDPLAHRYDNSSPYSYVFNNPTNLIDPDGMRVILGRNTVDNRDLTTQEIVMLVAGMQAMTDDKLKYNGDTGEVEIVEQGEGKKAEGTQLIRDMIGHERTATINYAVSSKKAPNGGLYAMPGASSGSPAGEPDNPNYYNGVGGDVEISFGVGGTYTYQDYKTGEFSEEQITLTGMMNHEFSHAIGQMDGTTRGGKPDKNNPRGRMIIHSYTDGEGTKHEKIPLEEATATFTNYRRPPSSKRKNYPTENSLNHEQGGKRRVEYGH